MYIYIYIYVFDFTEVMECPSGTCLVVPDIYICIYDTHMYMCIYIYDTNIYIHIYTYDFIDSHGVPLGYMPCSTRYIYIYVHTCIYMYVYI